MGNARGLSTAPDGRHALVRVTNAEGLSDYWTVQLTDGTRSRLTFETAPDDLSPFSVWSADSREVAYSAVRDGSTVIVRRPAEGGPERAILAVGSFSETNLVRVTTWSHDGSTLLYTGETNDAVKGVRAVRIGAGGSTGTRQPTIYGNDASSVVNGRLSPSEHWIAWQGASSGTVPGIFVERFPEGGGVVPVTDRGSLPTWSADGRSLYFASATGVLTRVDVTETGGVIRFGQPQTIMPIIVGRGYSYDVLKDGRIIALVTSDARAARPLTLVQNWMAAIR
jgi:Tol biopolymer transport system component